MKKIICTILCLVLALTFPASLSVLSISAEETDDVQTPDWIITEIGNDTSGTDKGYTNGYTGGADTFEFIELYNNSDRTLNLYDYALIYNGHGRGSENFENLIVESTPIKPGDYWDGSTFVPTDNTVYGDFSNKPVNPETCEVAPGEVVVLWMMYYESYLAMYNEGKGLSMADFRAHWQVPDDTKVIAVDANGAAKRGGHGKNFNVKNSEVGTYGIALQSEALNAATNTDDSTGLAGSFCENEDIIFWATVDFADQLFEGSRANATHHFTWDMAGHAAEDEVHFHQHDNRPYTYDARRGAPLTVYDAPSVGTLTLFQKLTLGVTIEAGETYLFDGATIYYPLLTKDIYGFIVDGTRYAYGETFTATESKVYDFAFSYTKEYLSETETEAMPDTESETLSETESTPTPDSEALSETLGESAPVTAPESELTDADTSTSESDTMPTSEAESKATQADGGCASVLSLAVGLPCLIGATSICARKREN